jgi:hypothetical protein
MDHEGLQSHSLGLETLACPLDDPDLHSMRRCYGFGRTTAKGNYLGPRTRYRPDDSFGGPRMDLFVLLFVAMVAQALIAGKFTLLHHFAFCSSSHFTLFSILRWSVHAFFPAVLRACTARTQRHR